MAARACFGEQGYAGTSNRDIAAHADVTPGAIYQYFDSKLALYTAALHEAVTNIAEHMRSHAVRGKDLPGALSEIVLGLLALHDTDPTLTPFFSAIALEARRSPEIERAIRPHREVILTVVREVVGPGIKRGELAEADLWGLMLMFVACTTGLSQFASVLDRKVLGAAVDAYVRLLDGSLFRKPAPTPRAKRR